MLPLVLRFLLGCLAVASALHSLPVLAQATAYQQPSTAVRELLDAPLLPRQLISPDRHTLASLELRRFSTIEELARPVLHLAGLRFEAGNSSPQAIQPIQRLRLRSLLNPDAPVRQVELPGNAAGAVFHSFSWAPDGLRFLLERRTVQRAVGWRYVQRADPADRIPEAEQGARPGRTGLVERA
jgi:hypothetical protein